MAIFERFTAQVADINQSTRAEGALPPNFGLLIETTRLDQIDKMVEGQSVLLHADLRAHPDGKGGNQMITMLRELNQSNQPDELPPLVDYLAKKGVRPVIFIGEYAPDGEKRSPERIEQVVKAVLAMTSRRGLGSNVMIATNNPEILALLKKEHSALTPPAGAKLGTAFDSFIMVKTAAEAAKQQWSQPDGGLSPEYAGTQLAVTPRNKDIAPSGKMLLIGDEEKPFLLRTQLVDIAGKALEYADAIVNNKTGPRISAPQLSEGGRRVLTAPPKKPTETPRQWVLVSQGHSLIK